MQLSESYWTEPEEISITFLQVVVSLLLLSYCSLFNFIFLIFLSPGFNIIWEITEVMEHLTLIQIRWNNINN